MTDSRRICIVNPFEHGGGAEYQIGQLIDALHASGGWRVTLLTHFLDTRERTRNYEVRRIGRGGVPLLGYAMDGPALYRTLAELEPDVIYQRVACAYTGICALYSRRTATPMVWHVSHDMELSPRALDSARNFVRSHLEKWLRGYGQRHATHVITQTDDQARLLRDNFAREPDAVVPNFHPLPAEAVDKSGPLTVLWIANLKPWKQPEIFVRLAHALRADARVRFIMVGAPAPAVGNQRWQRTLFDAIEAAGNVQYLGQLSQGEVNELLAKSHIFVNTSRHEGFPNTFIQAWMRETAVVSLVVDPDRVLERRAVGIAAHSETELLAAVKRLLDDPAARAAFAARGREHANKVHSLRNARQLAQRLGEFSNTAGLCRSTSTLDGS